MGALKSALAFLGLTSEDAPRRFRGASITDDTLLTATGGAPVIGPRLSFRGELSGEGDFHIHGRFEGEINVDGRVIVAEGAEVDANINAASIVIGGTVRGNLSASTRVEILGSGVLTGTLKTGSFSAADGASVKGEMWIERGAPPRSGPGSGTAG
jgi:cytoskeletal protein CcmA (bactofilin family)